MVQHTATVLWNNAIANGCYRIGLTGSDAYREAVPGQFAMVRLIDPGACLLGRPFSIHRRITEHEMIGIELLYKVVGGCTAKMSELAAGDRLDLLGPLGNGFTIPPEASRVHIVAGGIGVAPMVFLARLLVESGIDSDRCSAFLGARTASELLCRGDFADVGVSVRCTTDDGSLGEACLVTEALLDEMLKDAPDIIYACGPTDMLRYVARIAEGHDVRCQVSVETAMACGIGACLGCAVESRDPASPYLHACVDGPVFDAEALRL